jgi:hypothetical protein
VIKPYLKHIMSTLSHWRPSVPAFLPELFPVGDASCLGSRPQRSFSGQNRPVGMLSMGAVLLVAVYSGPLAAEPGFTITRAEAKLVNQVYHVSAEIDYEFSNKVLEAIQSGVPMVIGLDIEVRRPRSYLWDEQIAQLKQRFQLQYHALAEQYIVVNLNSGAQNTAPTLNTALYYLKNIDDLPLIDQQLLDPDEDYKVRLKVGLEFDSLPVPLKLSAYTSPRSWWLGSGWFVWDL